MVFNLRLLNYFNSYLHNLIVSQYIIFSQLFIIYQLINNFLDLSTNSKYK